MDEPTTIEMQQLKEDVREIKTALIGNPEMNQKGLVHLVEANTNYIEKDKKFKQKAVGLVMGFQAAIGGIVLWVKIKAFGG